MVESLSFCFTFLALQIDGNQSLLLQVLDPGSVFTSFQSALPFSADQLRAGFLFLPV